MWQSKQQLPVECMDSLEPLMCVKRIGLLCIDHMTWSCFWLRIVVQHMLDADIRQLFQHHWFPSIRLDIHQSLMENWTVWIGLQLARFLFHEWRLDNVFDVDLCELLLNGYESDVAVWTYFWYFHMCTLDQKHPQQTRLHNQLKSLKLRSDYQWLTDGSFILQFPSSVGFRIVRFKVDFNRVIWRIISNGQLNSTRQLTRLCHQEWRDWWWTVVNLHTI